MTQIKVKPTFNNICLNLQMDGKIILIAWKVKIHITAWVGFKRNVQPIADQEVDKSEIPLYLKLCNDNVMSENDGYFN